MTTFAILPVKRFDQAKQRLEPSLPPALRRELARAMVGDEARQHVQEPVHAARRQRFRQRVERPVEQARVVDEQAHDQAPRGASDGTRHEWTLCAPGISPARRRMA